MSVLGSSHQIFLTNSLTRNPKLRSRSSVICSSSPQQSPREKKKKKNENEKKLAQLAIVALAAGVLTVGDGDGEHMPPRPLAELVGRPSSQQLRALDQESTIPVSHSYRTNIYINPPVAPPLVGGYGYGYGSPFYGGWGWSPFSFFAPGPSVAVGVGGGFDTILLFMFLGAAAAVVRRFFGSRNEDDDY
ncbi:hypothetical protein Fmac_013106 [Flemingia macrophylla]|uniref:Transmembrane protein n=1 Tax=Flemingia macrophylla TaxID=520843 RepID=A0ABD1MUH1_9FABA